MSLRDHWVSQFDANAVPKAGPTACFRACRTICALMGHVMPEGTTRRWQLAEKDGPELETGVQPLRFNGQETAEASDHMVAECRAERPVIVGIEYRSGSFNRDGITDHFVVVARYDEETQELCGLNPGAVVPPGQDFNVAFKFDPVGIRWRRSWPEHLRDTVISMVVPRADVAAGLVERL